MCCCSGGTLCLIGCCPSLSDVFCGNCLTGDPNIEACPAACPAAAGPTCPIDPGSNPDLGNLPLTTPSGDPALDGLTPSSNATDTPPSTLSCPSAPRGGGSGGGSAMSAGGGKSGGLSLGGVPHGTQCAGSTALSSALSRLGTSLSTMFGKAETAKTGLEQKTVNAVTTPAFLFVILIVGVLLIMIAFGRKGE